MPETAHVASAACKSRSIQRKGGRNSEGQKRRKNTRPGQHAGRPPSCLWRSRFSACPQGNSHVFRREEEKSRFPLRDKTGLFQNRDRDRKQRLWPVVCSESSLPCPHGLGDGTKEPTNPFRKHPVQHFKRKSSLKTCRPWSGWNTVKRGPPDLRTNRDQSEKTRAAQGTSFVWLPRAYKAYGSAARSGLWTDVRELESQQGGRRPRGRSHFSRPGSGAACVPSPQSWCRAGP